MTLPVLFFDTHNFEKHYYENIPDLKFKFYDFRLNENSVLALPQAKVVCCFVNDKLNRAVLIHLKKLGVQTVALRCAGFNNVDMDCAKELGLNVERVPEYSPQAVAEHSMALLLTLVRKIHKSNNRVHEQNFSLEGLVGFNLHQKTVGIIGTGRIGKCFAQIAKGFGCNVIAYDPFPDFDWAASQQLSYVTIEDIWTRSKIISLHCPLTTESRHLMNSSAFDKMQDGVYIVNTSRGALIDTKALIYSLKNRKIGGAALDVYEEEEDIFFRDLSDQIIGDDRLARLMSFPNVLITSHQGFLTDEALKNIATTTINNIKKNNTT